MNYQFKYQQMSQALYEALKDDPFYKAIERSMDDREHARQKMLKYFDYSIYESQKYGEILIPEGNAYGVSVWNKPITDDVEAQRSKEKQAFLLLELGENALVTYNKIVNFMSDKAKPIICSKAWYLSIVGILPTHQGKGLGSHLISPVLSQTDQLGIPTYLETFTPRTKNFYRHLGYSEIGVFFEPTMQAEYTIMMREANTL
ncbi:GNAT family N-acetyltransferase [Vibrio coralliilyticus]|uniref:GNAT family N-acetyltransferase n=1 Tax=Vibrio coralliilyticus TaxID=190893 RepID=UPI001561A383|nr:GNAT family N-acetyltransferase [Vibrio coralliilyticus]NRF78404.1 GNAT family N-acetyltransferase [Vibrio coralliilyticus]